MLVKGPKPVLKGSAARDQGFPRLLLLTLRQHTGFNCVTMGVVHPRADIGRMEDTI